MQCEDQNFFNEGGGGVAFSFVGRGVRGGLIFLFVKCSMFEFSRWVPSLSISAHSLNLILKIQMKMSCIKHKYKEGPAIYVPFSADSRHGLKTSYNITKVTDLHFQFCFEGL